MYLPVEPFRKQIVYVSKYANGMDVDGGGGMNLPWKIDVDPIADDAILNSCGGAMADSIALYLYRPKNNRPKTNSKFFFCLCSANE